MEVSRTIFADTKSHEVYHEPDVVYAHRETGSLIMQVYSPVKAANTKPQVHPLYAKMAAEGYNF